MGSVIEFLRVFQYINGLASGYFLYRLCGCFVTWKDSRWAKITGFLGLTSLMVLPIYMVDVTNVLGLLLGMTVLVIICSEGTIAAKFSTVVIFYPVVLGLSFLKYDIAPLFFIKFIGANVVNVTASISVLLASTAVWAGIFIFFRDRLKGIKRYMTTRIYLTTDILCMAAFTAILAAIIFPSDYDREINAASRFTYQPKVGYLIVAASIISILASLVLMQRMTESVKEQMQLQAEKIKTEYYQTLLEQQERTRKLVHDINNHFQMVEGYLREKNIDEAVSYLARMKESLPAGTGRKFCSDSAVNALLNSRYTRLLEMHADVHFNIDIGNMTGIEPMDLCTLFGNILDNAIEALEQVGEERRTVKLQARCEKGLFTVSAVNSKVNGIVEQDGHILTGKDEKDVHGYGIENIKEITCRYGGKMEISYTEDEFSILVYMQV